MRGKRHLHEVTSCAGEIERLGLLSLLAAGLVGGAPAAAENFCLMAISGEPAAVGYVRALEEFFGPEVNRRLSEAGSAHRVEWLHAHDSAVADQQGVFEALEDQVADIGLVSVPHELERVPLEGVSYAAPFATANCAIVGEVVHALHGEIPAMAERWAAAGQTYLASATVDSYNVLSRSAIATVDNLIKKRIVVHRPMAAWLTDTGARVLPMTGAQAYDSLEDGAADAVIAQTTYMRAFRLYKVAKHLTRIDFGAMTAATLAIGADRLAGLPDDVQRAIRAAADDYVGVVAENYCVQASKDRTYMVATGVEIHELPRVERQNWAAALPHLARSWVERVEAGGQPARTVLRAYMQAMRDRKVRITRSWDHF